MAKRGGSSTRQLRIIGGNWRGRKIAFSEEPGLRPTPNRVRETLFNWLGPGLKGSRCVDLFAGSGALGLEALSRGAAHCDFFDTSDRVIRSIAQQIKEWPGAGSYQAQVADASLLPVPNEPWDIAFLDPPFDLGLVAPTLERLSQPGYLAPEAWIYVETAVADDSLDVLPRGYVCHRDKRAGDVRYGLLTVSSSD
jgi:16S rRNA (guanine966-N2)-methyltransferase